MRTLTLRAGTRVAVDAAQWVDAFAVVTDGQVQLELRDGEPGPVLGRDAGFWLRGTGVRALRNPGHSTTRLRIVTRRATTHRPTPTEYQALQTTVSLTAISLIPPVLWGSGGATATALIVLHLVAAMVMIPTLTRSLRSQTQ